LFSGIPRFPNSEPCKKIDSIKLKDAKSPEKYMKSEKSEKFQLIRYKENVHATNCKEM